MIILGIETSGSIGTVALCRDEQPLACHTFPQGVRHARNIMPAVDRLFREAGVERDAVQAVAVSQGPGSFTGLRIGVTCAKTLAWVLGWQIAGVPSLEVQAWNVPLEDAECTCPILDARREAVYGTVFRRSSSGWEDTTGVLLREPARLADTIPPGALVFGTGVQAYADVFNAERFEVGDPSLGIGRAEAVARLGLRRLRTGRPDDPMTLVPQYYRRTQAEEQIERRKRN